MFREASAVDAKDVDDDPRGPPAPAEAAVNHDVVALGDGQCTLVVPVDGMHESEETISPRRDPRAVLDVVRRKVALRGL